MSLLYCHGHRQPLCGATKPLVSCDSAATEPRSLGGSGHRARVARHGCAPAFGFPFEISCPALCGPSLFDSELERRFQTRIHMGPVSCDWIRFKVLVKSNKKPKIRADMLAFIQMLILERLP